MIYEKQTGVPRFESREYADRQREYVLLIPVINEGERIKRELLRAKEARIFDWVDIVICDGGSTDGSLEDEQLRKLEVNALLVKQDEGKQGAQLRMGIWWALKREYQGVLTIDGNNKDSIEDIPKFIEKLKAGYALVQGSRFIAGGKAINTPVVRYAAVRLIHAPIISLTAGQHFTDTTNAFRAYSRKYLEDPRVQPLRDVFMSYELLAYLSVRATQLGMRACEVPVRREYPLHGKPPTKISPWRGNTNLIMILFRNLIGKYNP